MLVEHNMNVVMSVSDVITVMHQGAVLAEGTPAEIAANEDRADRLSGRSVQIGCVRLHGNNYLMYKESIHLSGSITFLRALI